MLIFLMIKNNSFNVLTFNQFPSQIGLKICAFKTAGALS